MDQNWTTLGFVKITFIVKTMFLELKVQDSNNTDQTNNLQLTQLADH